MLSRVIRLTNILIAILLLAALALVYWFAWRPLPQTSGSISAPISMDAKVARDALGVPHITAGSIEDVLFLQGYVTAQDRLWQMEGLRRLASGQLSEIVGAAALESDSEARRLGLRRIAELHYRGLPKEDRVAFAAYARGVNHYIETHHGKWGLEFSVLRFDPKPWTPVDSIVAGLYMYRNLSTTWKTKMLRRNFLTVGDSKKVAALFPVWTGEEVQLGSNAWAISGKHTATGKPILANDPHLEWQLPATWYMIHLQCPGLNVRGVSLAGAPSVLIGHNERIAWGITNLHFDVQDLYLEEFDPQSGRYRAGEHMEQARLEKEVIQVRNGQSIELNIWITRHGPIFLSEGGQSFALRWTAGEPGGFQFPFLDINRAANWAEFQKALHRFTGPGSNLMYADVDGNIGYHAAGKFPIRKNYDGSVPVEGASGKYEWDGYIPFEELPSAFNPPSGYLISANQNPFPRNYKHQVTGNFSSQYRARQIEQRLKSREGWKPEEMLSIQTDVYSAFSRLLAEETVAAYQARGQKNTSLAGAAAILKSWDGQMDQKEPAPFLVALLFQHLRKAVADRAAPGKGIAYEPEIASSVLENLLRTRPKEWFEDFDQVLMRVFMDAVDEGKRIQGDNLQNWRYGRYNSLTIGHPVGSRLPGVGKYFNVGPTPMSGSSTTVKQTTLRLGPSMRFVADFSDWDHSFNNITIGQSGHVLSSHYKDQWESYISGRSYPMQFGVVQASDVLTVRPQ